VTAVGVRLPTNGNAKAYVQDLTRKRRIASTYSASRREQQHLAVSVFCFYTSAVVRDVDVAVSEATYMNRERQTHGELSARFPARRVVCAGCANRLRSCDVRNRHDSFADGHDRGDAHGDSAVEFIVDFAKVPVGPPTT